MASIKTPALLLFAVDASAKQPDPVAYEATMREGYKPMPNVTVVKVEDSRHFIMYDQPAKYRCGGGVILEVETSSNCMLVGLWWPKSNHHHSLAG